MKTTVEIDGYEITIEKTGDKINVTACKGDDCMEEFTLETEEGAVGADDELDEELPNMGEEEDFESEEGAEEAEETEEEESEEDETKLESFQSFIGRINKKK